MTKISDLAIAKAVRMGAVKEINEKGLSEFKQVAATKFAKDITVEIDGQEFTRVIRVDIVAIKNEVEATAEDLHQEFVKKEEEKAAIAAERAAEKAKKIAKDNERRAKKAAEKAAKEAEAQA